MYATHYAPDGYVVCRKDTAKTGHWLITVDRAAVTCWRCRGWKDPLETRGRCAVCHVVLPKRRRRFCSDRCRRAAARSERITEDDTYVRAVGRQVARLSTRAARDLDTLACLAQMSVQIKDALALAVEGARALGYSDREIGTALGVSHQAVQQRFKREPVSPARRQGNVAGAPPAGRGAA